jgi:hypothetical protein
MGRPLCKLLLSQRFSQSSLRGLNVATSCNIRTNALAIYQPLRKHGSTGLCVKIQQLAKMDHAKIREDDQRGFKVQ